MNNIAEKIIRAMRDKGVSKRDFIARSGLDPSQARRILDLKGGTMDPRFSTIVKCAQALETSTDYFRNDIEGIQPLFDIDPAYLREIKNAETKEVKELLARMATDFDYQLLSTMAMRVISFDEIRAVHTMGAIARKCRMRIQVLIDELSNIPKLYHRYKQSHTTYDNIRVEAKSLTKGTNIDVKMIKRHPNIVFYNLVFVPPPKRESIVEFEYEVSYLNGCRMSKLTPDRDSMEVHRENSRMLIKNITDQFSKTIKFPPGYRVRNTQIEIALDGVRLPFEEERIINGFSEDIKEDVQILYLKVDRPILGAHYNISWELPDREEYNKLVSPSIKQALEEQLKG